MPEPRSDPSSASLPAAARRAPGGTGLSAVRGRGRALLVAALVALVAPPAAADGAAPAPDASGVVLATPVFSLRRLPAALSRTVADTRLATGLDEVTGNGVLGPATEHTCLSVRDGSGRAVYSRQVDQALIPASSLKLVTGSVALAKIGGSTRFTTEVRAATPVQGATVGDLWLVGGGDPLLSTADFAVDGGYAGQPRLATPMEGLADRIVAAGIRTVQGRVIGDDSRYDDQRLVPTWLPRYIANFDVGPISALTVNEGFATPPPAPSYALSPASLAADVLAGLLRARGVTVGGSGEGRAPGAGAVVASIESPPMAEVVGEILQQSDNMAAEMMVKELGVRFGGAGTTAAGLAVIRDHLATLGLPLAGVATVDGSGLDRSDRVTCELLQGILATAGEGSELDRALPVAGRNGTLYRRFVGTPAAGQVRAKTGSLDGVVALAGWVAETPGAGAPGEPPSSLQFVLLANDLPTASIGAALQDKVANQLAVYPEAPAPGAIGPLPAQQAAAASAAAPPPVPAIAPP